jgi:hypothetical protein
MRRWLPVSGTILPGEQAVFTDTLPTLYKPGVYTSPFEWQIIYEDKAYPGQSLQVGAIVLPEELAHRRAELEKILQNWKNLPPDQVQARVEDWVEQQSGVNLPTVEVREIGPIQAGEGEIRQGEIRQGEIRPMDAFLIPLLMLPIVLIVGFILSRKNAGA